MQDFKLKRGAILTIDQYKSLTQWSKKSELIN